MSKSKWLDRFAGVSAMLGILGLILLLAHSLINGAWAQNPDDGGNVQPGAPGAPPPGFKPGARTFSNPFAPQAAGQGENFFPEDDEGGEGDFDSSFPEPDQGAPQQRAGRDSGGSGSSERGSSKAPISLGGQTPGGVIAGNKVAAIRVDDESAEGSKEIVTDFNFPDADIMDIAKALGKLTGKNFILDKDVKGRITIISNGAITVGDAWKAFLTSLDINGFALIPSGKFVRIARQRDARDKQLRTFVGDSSPDTDALITRVFPLKYLTADEVARNFRSFMPANSRIIPYDQTNTVIVTDTGSNIQKLSKLLEILDVEGYDAGIEVVPVKWASAVELSKLIDTLVPGSTVGGAAGGAAGPRFGGSGGKFTARRTKEGGIINTIIADERTNTLIVHANGKGADQVRELVAKLDQKLPASTGGGRVHVVYLQFADAEQIANTLNNLTQQSANRAPSPGGAAGGVGVNPTQATLFEGTIRVAPDKSTNALVVTASPQDFITVQRVVNKLDIPRDQVYSEVVIMEVTMDRKFDYSANVANPANGLASLTKPDDLASFITTRGATSKGAVLGFAQGSTIPITVGGQTVQVPGVAALIQLIQSNSFGNVLATPQILSLDNTEATFESAETIPFPVQNAVQGVGTQLSVNQQRISLSVTIKPQINKLSNFVKLDVNTKLADVSTRTPPPDVAKIAVGTQERVTKTSVVVGDGDTVVFGGLMRDNSTETTTKIPLLGDIPLLGWLFRSRSTQTIKSNLLIFITPTIIRQYERIRAVLDKKLEERDDFLEEHAGGRDPSRKSRDKMIKGLPDIGLLNNQPPNRVQSIPAPTDPDFSDIPETAPAATPVEPSPRGGVAPALPPTSAPNLPPAPTPEAPSFPGNGGGNADPMLPPPPVPST